MIFDGFWTEFYGCEQERDQIAKFDSVLERSILNLEEIKIF